jgi:predicted RNA binding protein with dsRBD fold (UPF0201 family)
VNGAVIRTIESGTLDPNERTNGTINYRPTREKLGALTVSISSGNNTDSRVITIVEPSVRIRNVTLTSTQLNETISRYVLTADILNISDDGHADVVSIAIPKQISLDGEPSVVAEDVMNNRIRVNSRATSANNGITFSISPNTSATVRDVGVTAKFAGKKQ